MGKVVATMAGTVLNILVSSGEKVIENQEVILIESMKMEIPIESAFGGVVKELKVNIGDFVNEGDVLLEIE